LPHIREMLNEMSNAEALAYARQCRVVVAKLRLCWNDINEEIKSSLKHKEYTEATIEHIRKDLIINKESVTMRKKPKREMVGSQSFCFVLFCFVSSLLLLDSIIWSLHMILGARWCRRYTCC
jgi:hypothetical protein